MHVQDATAWYFALRHDHSQPTPITCPTHTPAGCPLPATPRCRSCASLLPRHTAAHPPSRLPHLHRFRPRRPRRPRLPPVRQCRMPPSSASRRWVSATFSGPLRLPSRRPARTASMLAVCWSSTPVTMSSCWWSASSWLRGKLTCSALAKAVCHACGVCSMQLPLASGSCSTMRTQLSCVHGTAKAGLPE